MIQKFKKKILVAMSGGVDSSVAAVLLLEKGYDVTGAYMINFEDSETGNWKLETREKNLQLECWRNDYRDALRVAAKLGIPLIKLDFTKEYREFVLDYMFREYEAGRTPNPDVLCNKFVKFGAWLDRAKEMGFEKLATGHYARIMQHVTCNMEHKNQENVTCYMLHVACDSNKDQTYFLHQLAQDQLKHVLFPIGDYTKQEVRALAKKFDLPTAEKEESMGICFIGEVPMDEFLKTKIKSKIGNIVMTGGTVVGEHEGLAFYTNGQRHLRVISHKSEVISHKSEVISQGNTKPLYVVDKRFDTNELVVGYDDDPLLYKKEIRVKDMNWISGRAPEFPLYCAVRMRHRQDMQHATCNMQQGEMMIEFEKPQKAVTPGQFAVMYKDGECLGGGAVE